MPFPNVENDKASRHRLDEMVQSDFLVDFFASLKESLGADFGDYRFYIFSAKWDDVGLMPASLDQPGGKKILFYLSDETGRVPDELRPHYHAIFKTHLFRPPGGNIHPMSLGIANGVPVPDPLPTRERPTDIFFSGNLNRQRYNMYQQFVPPLRVLPDLNHSKLFAGFLKTPLARAFPRAFHGDRGGIRYDVTFTSGFRSGLSPQDYGERLARSRIALCPVGFISSESFRHTEALRAGCVVVSEPLKDTIFYRDSPFVIVKDWKEGVARANQLARAPDELEALQRRGLDWFATRLSSDAVARYVADCIRQTPEKSTAA